MAGRFSAKELTAINWYMKDKNYRLKLSTYPTIYFTNRDTNNEEAVDITYITKLYNIQDSEDKKQRAYARKQEREFQTRLPKGQF